MNLTRVLKAINEEARIRDFRDLLKGDYSNFSNYIRRLEILGFKSVYKGRFSSVFASDEQNVVIKVSTMNDQCWLAYAQMVVKNKTNPYYPRITGIRKMNMSGQDMYTAIIERLYPIPLTEWKNNPEYLMIQKYIKYLEYVDINSEPEPDQTWGHDEQVRNRQMKDFGDTELGRTISAVSELFSSKCNLDFGRTSFMTRKDGSLVIADPATGNSLGQFNEDDRQGELSLTVEPNKNRSTNPADLLNDQNFRSWFRNSKVVDKQGNPMIVYHGTTKQFDTFKKDSESYVGAPKDTFFFTNSPSVAGTYAGASKTFHDIWNDNGNIIPVFLSIQKPMRINAKGDNWDMINVKGEDYSTNDIARLARDNGYDGVIITNVVDQAASTKESGLSTIFIAFSPKQIKSAMNIGRWDRASDKMSEDHEGYPGNANVANSPEFKKWFNGSVVTDDTGNPLVLYHGTSSDFSTASGVFWGATNKDLANDYADMRTIMKNEYGEKSNADTNVIPVYMNLKNVFNADLGLSKSVTIPEIVMAMYEQAVDNGVLPDEEKVGDILDILRAAAEREGSGPQYGRYDFWMDTQDSFGSDGTQAVMDMFKQCGFDGIKMIVNKTISYGAIYPSSVKSVFNKGTWNPSSDNMSEAVREDEFKPGFKQWFGKSKVIDKQGNPLVVYHGSPNNFDRFDISYMGNTGTAIGKGFYFTDVKEFADGFAENGGKTYEVFLSIQKPMSLTKITVTKTQVAKLINFLEKNDYDVLSNWGDVTDPRSGGYDGVIRSTINHIFESNENDVDIFHDLFNAGGVEHDVFFSAIRNLLGYDGVIDVKDDCTIFVVFGPNQIKSVDAATFDPDSENIMDSIDI